MKKVEMTYPIDKLITCLTNENYCYTHTFSNLDPIPIVEIE